MTTALRLNIEAAIARAVDQVAEGRITRNAAIAKIAAAVAAAQREHTPAELVAQESAGLLAEFDRLGGGRAAAGKVARRFATDPLARETLARRVRRLVQKRNADTVRLPGGS
jgi:hypothetical protein